MTWWKHSSSMIAPVGSVRPEAGAVWLGFCGLRGRSNISPTDVLHVTSGIGLNCGRGRLRGPHAVKRRVVATIHGNQRDGDDGCEDGVDAAGDGRVHADVRGDEHAGDDAGPG